MTKTILIAGFGPGISTAVAERFGRDGYQCALIARNPERLAAGVKALEAKGLTARGFAADLSDPAKVREVVKRVRAELGPITAIHWNAYATTAGDLLGAEADAVRTATDIATVSLLATVQEAHGDLKAARGAVLVTNGGFGLSDPKVDAMCVQFNSMGLALANAAKHKLVGLLAERLKNDGIFVGEVMVLGTVKGTAWDSGQATLEASTVAEKFFALARERREVFVQVG